MAVFREWLLITEGRNDLVAPGVLQGYEAAFREELHKVVARTREPRLRAVLADMLDCPARDARGNCRSFTDLIVGTLLRNGLHRRYDLEACLSYVVEKMLMDTTERGEPRSGLFAGFEERPDYVAGNPLTARFLKFLEYAVRNIRKGRIPRLANAEKRPQGTVSIGRGRTKEGDVQSGVAPDEIAVPPSAENDLGEMVSDITDLLRRKEGRTGLPLAALFHAIMSGQRSEEQRRRFGDRAAREGRRIIVSVIGDYATSSGNVALLNLLARMRDGGATNRRAAVAAARPVLSDRERDYASIASVIGRFDRPVGTADLGRFRRRWLEYPPRDAASGFRNRLEEVLAAMVRDGVLKATRTAGGATVYEPGPGFEAYRGVRLWPEG